jgi:Resolvase, N terminal domain
MLSKSQDLPSARRSIVSALDLNRESVRTPAGETPSTEFTSRRGILRSSKILDLRLDRLAIVYVRQSDPQRVLNHRESRERQYALADHSVALGWPRERVMVIDDDQGQSGRTADQRSGFQRLLAEVTMEHLGMILGIEMSRIARNNKDWHNLLEMCAIFRTVLSDEDGDYDPQDTNDRLLLGPKGTISEFGILWADKQDLKRLRKLAATSHRGIVEYPAELITPKNRNRVAGGQP